MKTNGWWVTGLIDGEGCFYACPRSKGKGLGVNLKLHITQRADDLPVLVKIQEYLGVGKIYSHHRTKRGIRLNDACRLELATTDGWKAVIAHLQKYPLQSKKSRDFVIWKEIATMALKLNWPMYHNDMLTLCEKLHRVKDYKKSGTGRITDINICRLETA